MRRLLLLFTAGLLFLGLLTTASHPPQARAQGQWERIPPLRWRRPTTRSVSRWATRCSSSVARPPCPPNAFCRPSGLSPLQDGAIFDFGSVEWHRIAPAPVPLTWASTAVVGDAVYFLQPASAVDLPRATFLRYDVPADRWQIIPRPPAPPPRSDRTLREWGGRLIAMTAGEALAYDPELRAWAEIPNSPALHSAVPEEIARGIDAATWRCIDEVQTGWSWVWAGQRLVNPLNGRAEHVKRRDRRNHRRDDGSAPCPPCWLSPLAPVSAAGLSLCGLRLRRLRRGYGKVLDVPRGSWSRVPELPYLDGGAVQALVGDRIVVWGGFIGYCRSNEIRPTGYYWRITV